MDEITLLKEQLAAAQAALEEAEADRRTTAVNHDKMKEERDEARDWVRRMQSEQQVLTCVYCGHAYPPGTPASGSEVLTEHISKCEKHPMYALTIEVAKLRDKSFPTMPLKCVVIGGGLGICLEDSKGRFVCRIGDILYLEETYR